LFFFVQEFFFITFRRLLRIVSDQIIALLHNKE
jgi:hypothetical protein